MNIVRFLFFVYLLTFSAHAEYLQQWVVIKVLDGDTIDVQKQGGRRIRLSDIDAPEKKQPFGIEAKELLARKILYKSVDIKINSTDKYGRYIGTVFFNGDNVNRMMVSKGAAWVYRIYCIDKTMYALEMKARISKSGLWQDDTPMEPWLFRLNP